YLKRLDRGENFFDLFADDAQVCFPKWGVANGRAQIEKLFAEFASILSSIRHDYAYFNYIIQGDHVVVEGTSSGVTADGIEWREECGAHQVPLDREHAAGAHHEPAHYGNLARHGRRGGSRREVLAPGAYEQ